MKSFNNQLNQVKKNLLEKQQQLKQQIQSLAGRNPGSQPQAQ